MASEQPLEFHPDALAELEQAKSWYDTQRLGLGESFFQEITTAISRIREAPNTWLEYQRGTRRFLVHRFPFAVIYGHRSTGLLVLAVMHLKRRPGYWKERL
ncbi:MAG: type II toxin-antitoxin system RelE/ParE family toxin [Nitrospirota bacterium]|nr:type II toxin-antitoxin system RelE/ParE family toxin [Nitrospirota bacterium]